MDLNGTDNFINLGVAAIPDSTDFTMTAWVNIDTFAGGGSQAIIHLGDRFTPYDGTRMYIRSDGTNNGRIGLYDPDAAANNFTAAVAVTSGQWDLAAIRGVKGAGGDVTPLNSWVKISGLGEPDNDENPITGTITEQGTDDTDRMLIVVLSHEQAPPNEPTAVTYGGQSMTEGASNSTLGSGARDHDISVWWLNDSDIQSASSSTISSTWASPSDERRGGIGRFFTNVDQSSPIANVEGVDSTTLETLVFSSVTTTAGNLHFITANQANNSGYTSSSLDGLTNGNTTGFGFYSPGYSIGVAIGTSDGTSQTKSITCPGTVNRHGGIGLTLISSSGSDGTVDVSVNGEAWANLITGSTTGLVLGTTHHQSIGHTATDGNFTNWVNGQIADIRFYNRQLGQAEITTMYTARGGDGIVDGLLARYPLRGPIGAVVPVYGTLTSVDDSSNTVAYSATVITLNFAALSTQAGDLLIAIVGNGNEATGDPGDSAVAIDMSAEAGWALTNSGQHETAATVGGTLPTVYVFTRYARSGTEASYNFTADSACGLAGIALVYRSSSPLIFGSSVYSTGTSDSALSPAGTIQGDSDLVLNIALIDDFANAPITFDPKTLHQSAVEGTTDPNGLIIAVAEYLDASTSPTRQWSHGSDQWAALTLNWYANIVNDVSGSTGHPHNASSAGGPTFVETELR